jgi:pilus assembly protein CpaE
MVDLPRVFKNAINGPAGGKPGAPMPCVGVADGAIGQAERLTSLAALFPQVAFEAVRPNWPQSTDPGLDVLIVGVAGGRPEQVELALRRLTTEPAGTRIVVALSDADVTTTRRLIRAGAADVLPAPVSEAALALCLERLLTSDAAPHAPRRKSGEVVAVLKAGGGVGATALTVQMASLLAARGAGQVCVADLDLQFGAASVYLDLPDAITIADCLSSGPGLAETPFATALAAHRTGVRLLAAPREIVALETLGPAQVDALLDGLRRDFALTIVDLPADWTAWTNQVLQQADRIVLVTHLSVPHIQLVKRQLRVLISQQLDSKPLTLVCNSLSSDQTASVPIKAAERVLGRAFDVIIPEDRRVMFAALNQGIEIAAVRRGTKLEKAVSQLADRAGVTAAARGER